MKNTTEVFVHAERVVDPDDADAASALEITCPTCQAGWGAGCDSAPPTYDSATIAGLLAQAQVMHSLYKSRFDKWDNRDDLSLWESWTNVVTWLENLPRK